MRPFLLSVSVAILCSLWQPSAQGQEAGGGEYPVVSRMVKYTTQGEHTQGYLAEPKSPGKRPAIVLIHEWWGLNDSIKAKAREFAGRGYVALAVDLYDGKATTDRDEAGRLAAAVRGNFDQAFANLEDAIAYLKKLDTVNPDRLASIGWCFGGGWSYQIAKNNLGVKASVIYYGQFNPQDDLQKMRAEIIGHFAEEDRSIRLDDVKQFEATLKTQGGDHNLHLPTHDAWVC